MGLAAMRELRRSVVAQLMLMSDRSASRNNFFGGCDDSGSKSSTSDGGCGSAGDRGHQGIAAAAAGGIVSVRAGDSGGAGSIKREWPRKSHIAITIARDERAV